MIIVRYIKRQVSSLQPHLLILEQTIPHNYVGLHLPYHSSIQRKACLWPFIMMSSIACQQTLFEVNKAQIDIYIHVMYHYAMQTEAHMSTYPVN